MCYNKPKTDFSCTVTACNQNCPTGTQQCGAAACAKDEASCGAAIADMVVSPALMVAGAFSGGSAKAAGTAANVAAKSAKNALIDSLQEVKKGVAAGADSKGKYDLLDSAIEKLSLIGETDIAALSNDEIAGIISARYPPGSPEYKAIGRRWAQVVAVILAKEFQLELFQMVSGMADPSGVLGTIYAFSKPECGDHAPFPIK
jgi:hypothetical protein